MALKRLSYSFTRPSDTTAYTSGDLVANSTTAASVVPMSWNLGGSGGRLLGVALENNRTTITNGTFSIHFYGTSPVATAPTAGDNGAIATVQAKGLGILALTILVTSNDVGRTIIHAGETGFVYPWALPYPIVYGLIEAKAAYTPASAEVFTCELFVEK